MSFKQFLADKAITESTVDLKTLVDDIYEFALNDRQGQDVWDYGRSMFDQGTHPYSDDDEGGAPDPGPAVEYICERLWYHPIFNAKPGEPPDADDDILVRGGHFDAVAALTEPQRQELYDSLCEGVDSGLT